ncbi:hypothetical protein SSX86_001177 [Deinandra increscens subsp. villosa]|uniref:TF-B3 domain-containing protein n=1 Tax=Deinandra increscens subsp. villosa TaxID=3103831 RepID=A0AAP0DUA7_9ASTR
MLQSIPNSFRKYLKSSRKNEIAILRRGDQEWEVKVGDDWVFGEGWDDFMTENGVQDFDVVVFKHEGNMVFDTMVFDPTWCEREYSNDQVKKSVKKRKLDNNIGLPKVTTLTLTNPYFRSTITAYSIKRAIVNIPIAFARSNKLAMRNHELFVMDEKQRRWPTRLSDSRGRVRIYGSRDMWVANGLKEGDVFLLELVDNGYKPLMNLHAFSISKGKDACINQSRKSLLKAEKSSKTLIPNQNHHPCFVSTLKQHGTFKTMYLPKNFALANGLSSGEMIFKNVEKEGLWTVYLRSHWGKFFYVRRHGLREFCSAIGLEKGDSFRFELIDNGKKPVAIVSRLPKVTFTNPYFRSTVTATCIKRAIVNIPRAFARSNKLAMRDCELFVMDEKRRLWPTRLGDLGGHVRIHGSRDMLVANGLKEGDVFLLEVVDNGTLKISKGKDTCINQSTKSPLKSENTSKPMAPNQNHHPYFVTTLKQYGPFKSLYIPKKFALANGLISNGEMILKNMEKEGLWTAHLRTSLGNYFYVGHGWHGFCSAIGLVEGDTFRFELIHNGNKPVAIISRLSANTSAKVTSKVIPKAAITNRYFRSTVTAYSIKRAIVNIPMAFARSNELAMRNVELFVIDEKKRRWPTRLSDLGGHVLVKTETAKPPKSTFYFLTLLFSEESAHSSSMAVLRRSQPNSPSLLLLSLIQFCVLSLLACSSLAIAAGNGGGYTINGRVKIPGFGAQGFGLPVKANNAKVMLNGGQQVTFLKPDGYFSFHEVPAGTHLIEVDVIGYFFSPVRVDVSARNPGKVQAALTENRKGLSELVFEPLREEQYYEIREPFNIMSIVKSPMGLMIGFMVIVVFLMPKLVENMDPEEIRKAQEEMRSQGVPSLANLMPGAARSN